MKNALCAAGLGMLLATAAPAQDRATIERLNEAFSAEWKLATDIWNMNK